MAKSQYAVTLAHFEARIHESKNRQVSIPADVQRALNLQRQSDNHLIHVSIRPRGAGRWNHHYFKLTYDNEFAIPSDVGHLHQGEDIEVKIHRIIPDVALAVPQRQSGAGVLLALASKPRAGWREDGSVELDEYLRSEG
jgi:hypothetical protein